MTHSVNDPAESSISAAELLVMLRHLQRAGVQFVPGADPVAVHQLVSQAHANSVHPGKPITGTAATQTSAPRTSSPASSGPVQESDPLRAKLLKAAESIERNRAAVEAAAPHGRTSPVQETMYDTLQTETQYDQPPLPLAQRNDLFQQIVADVAVCTRCEVLACQRKHTVPGEGNLAARVLFLGEAPGADEDAAGRPFVGKSGQLLTKMIEACTFQREDVMILNTIKCRPPGNRNPEPDELQNCREYLDRQLELIQPEYIVCLGLVATKALLKTALTVGQLRGRIHRYRSSKVIVTYHPSYLLREPSAKKLAWADLQMLMRDMNIHPKGS